MIYITGDTHIPIDIKKLNIEKFPEQKQLTDKDHLIICGDFGGVWNYSQEEIYWLKWLNNKPFRTLFVDGNHENFNMLNNYPVENYCGGKVHRIMSRVDHLMRGQVFTIDGKKIFTMGGASSHDKEWRTIGKSWWAEELPSSEEYKEAEKNLDKADWKVDLVITHCAPQRVQNELFKWVNESDALTMFLDGVMSKLEYKHWYFGHYHTDRRIDHKHTAIYNVVESAYGI